MKKIVFSIIIFIFAPFFFLGKNTNFKAKELNKSDDYNFTNLVILAKFKDEEEFIDDNRDNTLIREIIDNMYNESTYSLNNYYSIQSNNKLRMKSVYLYDKDGNSITLSKDRGYYTEKSSENPNGYESYESSLRVTELIDDWSNAVNEALKNGGFISDAYKKERYDYSILDKNNDGVIDSINILYRESPSNISASWASVLWNYQYYCNKIVLNSNGKEITSDKYVQATIKNYTDNIYEDSKGHKIMNVGSITHEMGHVMGLYDLYSNGDESAVGFMSLMGKRLSPIPQNLSIKEKEALGWINDGQIQNINKTGEYIINSIKDDSDGVIGYKFKVSSSYTIYLEYRNFTTNKNTFDNKNKYLLNSKNEQYKGNYIKSGLICYLLKDDIRYPSNLNSKAPNWQYQALSYYDSEYHYDKDGTKNRCALGCDANGYYEYWDNVENLGFNLEIEEINEDSLTFSISGKIYTDDEEKIESISITGNPDAMSRNDKALLVAKINGNNIDSNANVCWSISNNTSSNTKIDNGSLIIGSDECGLTLRVTAKYKDVFAYVDIVINHDFIYHEKKEATCTNDGNVEYWYCKYCNKFYSDSNHINEIKSIIIDKKGHQEGNNVIENQKEASCSSEGYYDDVVYCKICNIELHRERIIIKKKNHNLIKHEKKEATCVDIGWNEYYTCSNCDYTTYEEIKVLAHQEENKVIENQKEASCSSEGYYDDVVYCKICNTELHRERITIKKKNHNLIKHEKKEATCVDIGWNEYYTCSSCDYTTYEEIKALAHQEGNKVIENQKEASCSSEGYYDNVVYCKVCNTELHRERIIIKALNHDVVILPAKTATCVDEGLTEGKICSRCGEVLLHQEKIEKTEHQESDWIIDIKESKKEIGHKHKECMYCHKILLEEDIPMISSNNKLDNIIIGISIPSLGVLLTMIVFLIRLLIKK